MACQLIPNLRGPTDGWCRRVSWSAICVDKAKTERTSKIFECLKRAVSILCSCTLLLYSFPQNLEQNTYVPFFHDNFFLKFFVGFFLLLIFGSGHSIMTHTTGVTKNTSTLTAERLGLTQKRPSYQPTGKHHSPRSVLEWRSAIKSTSLS